MRDIKTMAGWIVLLLVSFSPVYLWLHFGDGLSKLTDYPSITHSLGELFGLIGMTAFALTFMLSTRISWIEDIFGGLDKVYITHAVLGGAALIFILGHPIFLVLKFIPYNMQLAARYILFSSYWSVNFGIIAILGMIVLIVITLFTKMRYDHWKFTHEFFGLIFIFAVMHTFLVRNTISQDNIFDGYYIYAVIVSIIGIFGFSYSLFIKNRLFKNAVYSVGSIRRMKDIFEITISPEHKPIQYKAGQFIFVRFYNEKISKEAHPFSIASGSGSEDITIIVKQLGDYTKRLIHLKEGDKVSVEGPYGRFDYKRYHKKDQVWIAGGIGISPFIGMAEDILEDSGFDRKVTLIYSVKEKDELIKEELFQEISRKTERFRFLPWLSGRQGDIDPKAIYENSGRFKDKEFFLCGPPEFKERIIKELIRKGVSKGHIHEETFDLR